MKTVILDGKTLGDDINLNIFGDDTEIYGTTEPELVAERIKNAEVVIINKIKLFEDNLKDAKNLKGSIFKMKNAKRKCNILLVDDFFSTGETATECVSVLKTDPMIEYVYYLAIAKTK